MHFIGGGLSDRLGFSYYKLCNFMVINFMVYANHENLNNEMFCYTVYTCVCVRVYCLKDVKHGIDVLSTHLL